MNSVEPLEFVPNPDFRKATYQRKVLDEALPALPTPLCYEPWALQPPKGGLTYVMGREEERGRFQAYNFFKWRYNILRKKFMAGHDGAFKVVDDFQEIYRRAVRMEEYLTRVNMPLVYAFVARNRNRFGILDWDEAVSEAGMSLLRAIKGYDVLIGVKFSTYAVRIILNGLSSATQKAQKKRSRVGYTDLPDVYSGEEDIVLEQNGDPEEVDALRYVLDNNLADLTPTEKAVVAMRFGLGDRDDLTLEQTGDNIGVSKERIRQIQNKALEKLRAAMVQVA